MMCLGWKDRETCKIKNPADQVSVPGTGVTGNGGSASCNVTWFWVALAGLLTVGVVRKV